MLGKGQVLLGSELFWYYLFFSSPWGKAGLALPLARHHPIGMTSVKVSQSLQPAGLPAASGWG